MPNYFLQDGVELVLHEGRLTLERRGVPVHHVLRPGEAVALSFLAATGSPEQAKDFGRQCHPDAEAWLDRVLQRYPTYLGDGVPREIPLERLQAALRSANALPIIGHPVRDSAPASLTWLVTMGCNRHCPYCFFDVYTHAAGAASPPDCTFSRAAVERMIGEMANIGTADLYLTGGEPLLRTDLPDLIAKATQVRVRTHISTKLAINARLAARLAAAGLTQATVSVDDSRPTIIDLMAGARGYSNESRATLLNLLEAGVPVEVNAVVTSWNAAHLDGLCIWLIELGVPQLKLSRFNPPYPRSAPVDRMNTNADVGMLVDRLQSRYGHRLRIYADLSSVSDGDEAFCGGSLVCEVGTRTLDILPDGSVTRCHYLPSRPELVLGSLETSSLLDIWNATRRPVRDQYEGNACHTCDGFEGCNDRGRCYVSALMQSGSLHAPDRFCTAAS